jgi:glycosyltransferase involved in cell wall biosynthesis
MVASVSVPRPERPRVSVIVPCFNLGQYVDEAVDSVLAQTFQDLEIVIVDDGSTDAVTIERLAQYNRPKTRALRMPHAGLAAARNAGIAHSTGTYLCALDADDRLDPSYLAKAVEVLERDPSVTFVSAWLRTFGVEHWEWTPERCDLPTLLWENTVLTAAVVRRDAVAAVGGYDTAMPRQGDEDWDLWLTLVERGHRGIILPEILFNYRRRPGSMSTVCWHGPDHLPLAEYRLAKHRETYEGNLLEVLLHQDADTAALLRRNDELERQIASELEPAVALRKEELALLESRLDTLDRQDRTTARVSELASALESAHAEIAALRTSMSWRVTAPLRGAYGWWLRRRSSE